MYLIVAGYDLFCTNVQVCFLILLHFIYITLNCEMLYKKIGIKQEKTLKKNLKRGEVVKNKC